MSLLNTLINCLVNCYNMDFQNASIIVEEEYEYIETLFLDECDIDAIAKELLVIYMVA